MPHKTTVVTKFFDLTMVKDGNGQVRNSAFYMDHGKATLSIDCTMVIFFDENTKPLI
jgi:hypothetical protein